MAQLDQTSASRAVLIEVANVLGAYRQELVLVGGWVPELLFPNLGHIGSLDVDLAVSPKAVAANVYETILKRMLDAGYSHQTNPTRFVKGVAGAPEPVKVDLISGQFQTGVQSSTIQVNELQLSCLRGIDLAFQASSEHEVSGTMPDGSKNAVRVRIVRPEAYILIKAFALDERQKPKDAYDVAFVLQHYSPDLQALAKRLRPLVATDLGDEAYRILKGKFASLDSVGPKWAAQVLEEHGVIVENEPGTGTGGLDREQAERAAFENAQELFRAVDHLG